MSFPTVERWASLWCGSHAFIATSEQRERVEIGPTGLHWKALDEDISIAGLLAGRGDQTRFGRAARADLAVFDEIMSRPGGLEPPEEDRL